MKLSAYNFPALALALAVFPACNDRALSEDMNARVQEYCDNFCPHLAECLPVGPDYVEPELWAQEIETCEPTCFQDRLDRLDDPELVCQLEKFEHSECVASKTSCEGFRAAYFMDGPAEESCVSEEKAWTDCQGWPESDGTERWPGIPTP